MSTRNVVVLVDDDGNVVGTQDKLAAHESPGHLHLAFSVVLYRADGRILLQQRAASKYHFPLLWANACCSHPGPGENIHDSAVDRVSEELGVRCELQAAGIFTYTARCPSTGRVEYERDHVFVGTIDQEPAPDADEVAALRWVDDDELGELVRNGATVPWLAKALHLAAAAKDAAGTTRPE